MASAGTVLIVEDDTTLAETYASHLRNRWTVRIAHDGPTALQQLDETVEVVLLDRQLPGQSGDGVLQDIREGPVDCRVALVTAREPEVDILELGFDEYLVKPVSGEELRNVVDRLVTRARYNEITQSLYAALRKRELLRKRHSEAALQDHEEYENLVEEIESLRTKARRLGMDLQHGDFRALFHDIGSTGPESFQDQADA